MFELGKTILGAKMDVESLELVAGKTNLLSHKFKADRETVLDAVETIGKEIVDIYE